MKAQRPVGLALSWPRATSVFLTDVALLAAGSALPSRRAFWVAAAVAVVVTALALVTVRRVSLLSAVFWGRVGVAAALDTATGKAIDHRRRFGEGVVGIREQRRLLVAVVAVDGPSHPPSVLDRHTVASATMLPLNVVANALRQFDIQLNNIDVVSVGSRRTLNAGHPYAPVYSAIVGDHAAVGQRRTWLVLRMDPQRNVSAVAWRDSVASTLAAAAERLAHELTTRRCAAHPLTAAQMDAADSALLAGFTAAGARAGWREIRHRSGYVTAFWVSPDDIGGATLTRLWRPDTDATAVTVRLTPAASGGVCVACWARYHTGAPLQEAPLLGLNRMSGRHLAALRFGLPVPSAGSFDVPARALGADEGLAAPIGPNGQLFGVTGRGLPMLLPLTAPTGHARVTVAAELPVLVQLALRAAATGHYVIVCTSRPRQWSYASGPALYVVAAMPESLPRCSLPVVLVCDGVAEPPPMPGVAVTVTTVAHGTASIADIHFEQDSASTMVVRTTEFQSRVHIDVASERRYLWVPEKVPSPPAVAGRWRRGTPVDGHVREGSSARR
ncbi:MAG: type VII secretion protein EccE [Mycobacteriaceae bacterium]|nr:type VII secretion protein EccE [Mycobacteriaceae bacterium]